MKSTPSFAVLSSPADSPPIPPVPPTPSFNSQVESVIRKRKRDDETPSKTPSRKNHPLRDAFDSHSSSCSQDSVEKHLTQSMEICDDDLSSQVDTNMKNTGILSIVEGTHAADMQSKEKSETEVFQRKPSQVRMGALLQPISLPRRPQSKQAWYGTRLPTTPTVKQKKSTSTTNSRAPSDISLSLVSNLPHPKTPPVDQPRRSHPTTLNTYRSGILEIASSVAVAANTRVQEEEQGVSDSQTSSQSQEFESSVEYLSYPLQTQAPYQSQNFSQ
ncbi:hypothetical protein BDZ94DRAFT_1256322 [Collybia nuda]|uniref:Uncharacterized protein n=1 Tax=Collybia nuda TaxID=64659 RepID=A0A9P5YAN0_9AGAR|nr:hypothetical protein BDZ94DRAFT_1256322 [Collybia nuda]